MIHFKNSKDYALFATSHSTRIRLKKENAGNVKKITTGKRKLSKKSYGPTEHDIQTVIMHWFTRNGWLVWRNNSGKIVVGEGRFRRMIHMGKVGMPDVLAIKDGILAAVEVKRPKGKTTPIQEEVLKDLEKHGAWTLVAHSVDEVEAKFKVV